MIRSAPDRAAASSPSRIAARTGSAESPSITISSTDPTPSGTWLSSICARSVGHSTWFVEAISALYRDPTLLPLRAIPPGNGMIAPSTARIASAAALRSAEAAAAAMRAVEGAILPFPGGITRSGSKVGSRYKALIASTNHVLCPALRAQVDDSQVPDGVGSVLEIVIDGLAADPVREAMRVGLEAAARSGALLITAGNYGGSLGKHHFHLRELVP